MKIKLHSIYDNPSFTGDKIPTYIEWSKTEGDLDCFVDSCILSEYDDITDKSIAMLIEPRSIQPDVYSFVKKHWKKFKYIFTHDSILLSSLPNAKVLLFGGVYGIYIKPKTKGISIVSSNKDMCELHEIRADLCRRFEGDPKVDCYGTYDGGTFATTEQIYADYKYSIVIENYRDDYWFTEKICNAFANRCIPIYYGARKISEFFNPSGIIQLDDPYDVFNVVENLDVNKDYLYRLPGMIANYELVKRFSVFEDWFHSEYMELLQEVASG